MTSGRGVGGGGGCCPLQARYQKRGAEAVRLLMHDAKSGGGGGLLSEKGVVPYMKGGVATPQTPPCIRPWCVVRIWYITAFVCLMRTGTVRACECVCWTKNCARVCMCMLVDKICVCMVHVCVF